MKKKHLCAEGALGGKKQSSHVPREHGGKKHQVCRQSTWRKKTKFTCAEGAWRKKNIKCAGGALGGKKTKFKCAGGALGKKQLNTLFPLGSCCALNLI